MTRAPRLLAAVLLTLTLAACGDDGDAADTGDTGDTGDADRSPTSEPAVDVTEEPEAPETGAATVECPPAPAGGGVDTSGGRTMYSSASAAFVVTRADGTSTCLTADGLSADSILGSYVDPEEPEVSLTIGDAEAGVVLTYTPDVLPLAPGSLGTSDYFFGIQAEGDYFPIYSGCSLLLMGMSAASTTVEFSCGAAEGTGEGPFSGADVEPATNGIAAVTGWLTAAS
ncbi:hypothetical protein ABFT23_03840 [Nocardioides sp. C4-1]|uniref:hypothetical protein n=1 Tax=Nocardioides sp. C4-1 TaxID=3151851 RepID=UPI003262DBAD